MIVIDAKDLNGPALTQLLDRVSARAAASNKARLKGPALAPQPFNLDELDRIRAMTPPGPQEDSVAMIRALRDE
jgi:hypothetical protein